MEDNLKIELAQFLQKIASQKDVSLMIAKNSKEIKAFETALIGQGFKMVGNILELISALNSPAKPARLYISPDHSNVKPLYDFLVQYPTGQVEIFDDKEMKSKVFNPDYANSAVVLLISSEELKRLESNNFSFLQYTGLAFQN